MDCIFWKLPLKIWLGDRYGEFSTRFPLQFPTRFPTQFPARFPAEFPARFSHKNFLQDFPTRFSHKNFLQDFPARISHKIFPQEFPAKIFLQDFPARFYCKIFLQEFPTRFSHKIFLSWILIGWLPFTLFQMLNFHQSLPFLNWLFSPPCPARFSREIFLQDFPARFSWAGSWLVGSPSPYSKC